MEAVYVGDSNNYHIFQVVDKKVVGTLYLNKEKDIPESLEVSLVTPNRDKPLWNFHIEDLLDRARDGSKQKQKLLKIKKEYSK